MGKTGMAGNLATHAALHEGLHVAFFSLDMSDVQIGDRIVCGEAGVDSQRHRDGCLDDAEWSRMHAAAQRLYDASYSSKTARTC